MHWKCITYLHLESKSESSGLTGNFVASWIVVCCWLTCKRTIILICRIRSGSLPKFSQFFTDHLIHIVAFFLKIHSDSVDSIQIMHACECDIQMWCPEVEMSTQGWSLSVDNSIEGHQIWTARTGMLYLFCHMTNYRN